ncbi:MAG: Spy/CpxP family protein refolding chaperone [Pseudomonadota bacterium]
MKSLLLSATLAFAAPTLALAQPMTPQEMGLSAPVIALVPVMAKNAEALKFDDAQKAELKAWMETMGPKRVGLEKETAELRARMRQAIVDNAPAADREALAAKIGANETALVMMRSNGGDHGRSVLTPDQFAQVVAMAGGK